MCEFDFDTKHIKGKEKKGVDALSRRVHDMHVSTVSMCKSDLKTKILDVVVLYKHYLYAKQELQHEFVQQRYGYHKLEDHGILKWRSIVYVPNSQELRKLVMKEMHNTIYVGHIGYQKTFETVKRQYIWP